MSLSNQKPTSQKVTDLAEKDLDFIFSLMFLGEDNSRDERVWGAFLKEKYDQHTGRRLYVRMLISLVESVIATLKFEALRTGSGKFSQAELALLEDKAYELSDRGEAIERPFFGRIEKSLRFAFRCYAKASGLDFVPNYNSDGWQAFRQAVKIRNRITHPKRIENMTINDIEQQLIDRAHDWFIESYRGLLQAQIVKLSSIMASSQGPE